MPRIARPDPAARGVYLQKKSYWLRYTYGRKQVRAPLHTRDFGEAVEKAKEIRGRPEMERASKPNPEEFPSWKQALDGYIADKLAGHKPPHLVGKRLRSFRPGTAERTRGLLDYFARWVKTRTPFEVAKEDLQKYYDFRKKRSVASAKTIVDRICCFLDHIGHFVKKPEYPEQDAKEIREVVVTPEEYAQMIANSKSDTLKFVLYCGFHCGMRRAEIVHARPDWFHLAGKNPYVRVPPKEKQQLANGKTYQWRSKNGKQPRSIPLGTEFASWLSGFLDKKALFCVKPQACSKRYRYDYRKSFESYMRLCGREDVSIHSMRHSYITNLCNSSNKEITIMKVSAWSGDTIETIQRHYWHKQVFAEGLDDTLAGRTPENPLKEAVGLLKNMPKISLDKEVTEAITNLLKAADKKEAAWEWTEDAPAVHAKLYSVEDTVTKFGVFQGLIDQGTGEPDDVPSIEDWEEGKISTVRARLKVLEKRGLISKV